MATMRTAVAAAIGASLSYYFYYYCDYLLRNHRWSSSSSSLSTKTHKSISSKKLRRGLVDAIGNTPLIRINSLSESTGCEVDCLFFLSRTHLFLSDFMIWVVLFFNLQMVVNLLISLLLNGFAGFQILAKAEFLNPGGSVKDRVAVKIIEEVHDFELSSRQLFFFHVGFFGVDITLLICFRLHLL